MEEISDGNILEGPNPLYEPENGGLGFELFSSMTLNRTKIAQHFINTGESDTYAELLGKCVGTAMYMSKKNLKTGDIICLCSGNHKDSMVPIIATQFLGLIYSAIEPTMLDEDLIYWLDSLRPKIVFVEENVVNKMESCLEKSGVACELIVFGKTQRHVEFSALPKSLKEDFKPVFVEDLTRTALIFLSSGTTGKSKGACINHLAALGQIFNFNAGIVARGTATFSNFTMTFDEVENPSFMSYSPVYWMSAVLISFSMIFSGGATVIGTIFDPESAWAALDKYKPNVFFLPPGQAKTLCLYGLEKFPKPSFDVFLTGGGLVLKSHLETMKACFPETTIRQTYGQTENFGSYTFFDVRKPEDSKLQQERPESCGRVTPGNRIKIVDVESEQICGVKQQGELRSKSKYLMNGYYKLDSSFAFDSDGWFKTGDLAYFDEQGCIYIVDRIKDILLYTVHNIQPSVIEEILAKHPAVLESTVIGLPHPEDNEHPMGVVVLRKEYENKVEEQEIVNFVNCRVPADKYKIRGGIKFLDEIPKTPSGKLKKIQLKQLIIDGKL